MDSFDVAVHGVVGKKTPEWSYKKNHRGRRYMDANGRIRELYGGHSPKLYDAHWVQANSKFMEQTFNRAVIIADQHFRSAGRMRGVSILAAEGPSRRKDFNSHQQWQAYKERRKRNNKEIIHLRARIESPFRADREQVQGTQGHLRGLRRTAGLPRLHCRCSSQF